MKMKWTRLAFALFLAFGCFWVTASAQSPEVQQKVAELKQAMAQNQQALAQYQWQETMTISLKGEQKKQEHFSVRMGPDGKPQKTSLDPPPSTSSDDSGRRGGRLKEHVVEKKKAEYQDYADQIKSLIQQYLPPNKDTIQQAFQAGNVTLGSAGAPGEYSLNIANYLKQGDKMVIAFNKAQHSITSLSLNSYLSDPKDAVNVAVTFSSVPGGPNHIDTETINGVSKQLTIVVQNSSYQTLQ
jgi:hypothetical protein